MIRHSYLFALSISLFASIYACTNNTPAPAAATPTPVQVTMQEYAFKKCLHDSVCAEVKLVYPVLSGGSDPAAMARMNDSIHTALYIAVNANPKLPLQQALDSAALELFHLLQGDDKASPVSGMSYTYELNSKVLLQTGNLLSVQMDGYSFTGGAHGYYYTVLNTFDLRNAQSVLLTDIVADTVALRPIVEKAFAAAHKEELQGNNMSDLLLEPNAPLDFPANYCIIREGLRLVYNPYEVTAYALGQTDLTLTWEQLGVLADRKKWLE